MVLAAAGAVALAFVTLRSAGVPDFVPLAIGGLALILGARGLVGLSGIRSIIYSLRHPTGWPGNRSPRTESEIVEVIARRPPGWEYFAMAGYLLVGRDQVEPRYLDHEIRYAPPSPQSIPDEQVPGFLQQANTEALGLIANFSALFDPAVIERAMGPPGQPGDPVRIRHLAERWTETYQDLLQWAARLRSVGKSDSYRPLFDGLARLLDTTVKNYRETVDLYVATADKIPAALKAKEPWVQHITFVMDVDDEALVELQREIERLS
jgi:hypothetical protein